MPDENKDKKYKLLHDRPGCIGCSACAAVAPDFWEMSDDGKSDIKGGKDKEDGWQEKDISEDEFQENMEAAESCPVNVIHLKKLENNEDLI
ncbi:ferredoxin [Candidatus Woesearchaeota archaeon]|nr:ferredoxin [Candidatus Woesearchaeota archaeon]MCF7901065.1 ferredoxin [Candidatus Woesearchaeota archaeon]MCF8013616.1 ferredoxin [Candidatus Woesearchaeota archaeon]